MQVNMKRRLIVVTVIIVAVLVAVLWVVGQNGAAASVSVSQASSGDYAQKKVQVSGTVVDNSYETRDGVLYFSIADEDDPTSTMQVEYSGSAASTFGNGVTAICTGTMDAASGSSATLTCTELVTKCPSKYESSTDVLSVSALLEYGEDIVDKTVKVQGVLAHDSAADSYVLADPDDGTVTVPVSFELTDASAVSTGQVVLTGTLLADGSFTATQCEQG